MFINSESFLFSTRWNQQWLLFHSGAMPSSPSFDGLLGVFPMPPIFDGQYPRAFADKLRHEANEAYKKYGVKPYDETPYGAERPSNSNAQPWILQLSPRPYPTPHSVQQEKKEQERQLQAQQQEQQLAQQQEQQQAQQPLLPPTYQQQQEKQPLLPPTYQQQQAKQPLLPPTYQQQQAVPDCNHNPYGYKNKQGNEIDKEALDQVIAGERQKILEQQRQQANTVSGGQRPEPTVRYDSQGTGSGMEITATTVPRDPEQQQQQQQQAQQQAEPDGKYGYNPLRGYRELNKTALAQVLADQQKEIDEQQPQQPNTASGGKRIEPTVRNESQDTGSGMEITAATGPQDTVETVFHYNDIEQLQIVDSTVYPGHQLEENTATNDDINQQSAAFNEMIETVNNANDQISDRSDDNESVLTHDSSLPASANRDSVSVETCPSGAAVMAAGSANRTGAGVTLRVQEDGTQWGDNKHREGGTERGETLGVRSRSCHF